MNRVCVAALSLSLVAGLATSAHSAITAIYTKIPTSPTSVIPGALDTAGAPAVTNWRAMEGLVLSPDGSQWMLKGRTQITPDAETILVRGSGMSGTMFAQENQAIPTGAAGELYDFFGSSTAAGVFDDNNNFAFAARAKGGVASVFQKVIQWTNVGNSFAIRFQMGDLISGLQDTGATGDETVGNSVGSIHLLNDGRIGAQDSTVLGIATARRPVLMYKSSGAGPINGFKQINVDTAVGFGGIGTVTYTALSANLFYTTPDGNHWAVKGQFNTGTATDIFVYDGQVRLQAGQVVPGSGTTVSTVLNFQLLSNGTWITRGASTSGPYAARNDGLLAAGGGSITTGSTEVWTTAQTNFVGVSGTVWGDFAIAGKTNNADAGLDDVIVVNGNRVVLREGDPVDVNGNGLFDDNAFVGRGVNTNSAFVADSMVLAPNRSIYALINIKDGSGNDLTSSPAFGTPNAFVHITWCHADLDNGSGNGIPDGGVDISDLLYFLARFEAGSVAADIDNGSVTGTPDGGVDISDLLYFLARFEAGC